MSKNPSDNEIIFFFFFLQIHTSEDKSCNCEFLRASARIQRKSDFKGLKTQLGLSIATKYSHLFGFKDK